MSSKAYKQPWLRNVLPLCMHNTCIDVLKIDTEGADAFVLKGEAQLLRERKIRHIFFEEKLVRMKELSIHPGTAQKILREYGYTIRHLSSSEWYAAPDHA